ncbi:fungal fucose-specific lectin [Terfezia boudieri ATCC MYA-4762]|uniref:Fungal fucose-specific lectin n=1 Tax=Terfezia boudieri ATCC MYA-4762 TaxID=1051890 RepID=A0A3N4LL15_9PEZI|nr:fungal fucose-specific lectin [Terfezia boudieri ATCC MYA-4762]
MANTLTVNTATACIAFGNVHLRVYFQDNEGYVRESQWDGSWTAITWGSTPHIRVYYVDTNNKLAEHCWDGSGWYTGALGGSNIALDYRSKIGACTWSNTPSIRVYYQSPGNQAIREVCWDGNGWTGGATLPNAQLGSGLAAIAFSNNGIHLRVYYQTRDDNTVREHCWDGSWSVGQMTAQAPAGTAIGATTWASDPQIRVYIEQTHGGHVSEMAYSGGWSGPNVLTNCLADTNLSVCSWGNIQIRFYFQRVVNEIQEYCWNNGWVNGATIPTD